MQGRRGKEPGRSGRGPEQRIPLRNRWSNGCNSPRLACSADFDVLGAEAQGNFAKYRAPCHGADGTAHTKAARQLKVRDLADAAYPKSFTDGAAFSDVKNGAQESDGHVKMKPFKDNLTDPELKALIAYVRTLAK
jgi:hypothetical protein